MIFDLNENVEYLHDLRQSFADRDIYYIQMDITKRETIENAYKEAFAKIGHFDVVVNGSGLMNDRHIDLTIQINLVSRQICFFKYILQN